MSSALLVVDVQHAFFEDPGLAHDADAVLGRITDLVADARDAEVPVVYVQHDGESGHPAEVGTRGWEIADRIVPSDDEPVIRKRACDSFDDSDLGTVLRERDVERVVTVGFATEQCVDTTCRRALSEGFDVTLVSDAHTTVDRDDLPATTTIVHHNAVLPTVVHPERAVTVLPSAEVAFDRSSTTV